MNRESDLKMAMSNSNKNNLFKRIMYGFFSVAMIVGLVVGFDMMFLGGWKGIQNDKDAMKVGGDFEGSSMVYIGSTPMKDDNNESGRKDNNVDSTVSFTRNGELASIQINSDNSLKQNGEKEKIVEEYPDLTKSTDNLSKAPYYTPREEIGVLKSSNPYGHSSLRSSSLLDRRSNLLSHFSFNPFSYKSKSHLLSDGSKEEDLNNNNKQGLWNEIIGRLSGLEKKVSDLLSGHKDEEKKENTVPVLPFDNKNETITPKINSGLNEKEVKIIEEKNTEDKKKDNTLINQPIVSESKKIENKEQLTNENVTPAVQSSNSIELPSLNDKILQTQNITPNENLNVLKASGQNQEIKNKPEILSTKEPANSAVAAPLENSQAILSTKSTPENLPTNSPFEISNQKITTTEGNKVETSSQKEKNLDDEKKKEDSNTKNTSSSVPEKSTNTFDNISKNLSSNLNTNNIIDIKNNNTDSFSSDTKSLSTPSHTPISQSTNVFILPPLEDKKKKSEDNEEKTASKNVSTSDAKKEIIPAEQINNTPLIQAVAEKLNTSSPNEPQTLNNTTLSTNAQNNQDKQNLNGINETGYSNDPLKITDINNQNEIQPLSYPSVQTGLKELLAPSSIFSDSSLSKNNEFLDKILMTPSPVLPNINPQEKNGIKDLGAEQNIKTENNNIINRTQNNDKKEVNIGQEQNKDNSDEKFPQSGYDGSNASGQVKEPLNDTTIQPTSDLAKSIMNNNLVLKPENNEISKFNNGLDIPKDSNKKPDSESPEKSEKNVKKDSMPKPEENTLKIPDDSTKLTPENQKSIQNQNKPNDPLQNIHSLGPEKSLISQIPFLDQFNPKNTGGVGMKISYTKIQVKENGKNVKTQEVLNIGEIGPKKNENESKKDGKVVKKSKKGNKNNKKNEMKTESKKNTDNKDDKKENDDRGIIVLKPTENEKKEEPSKPEIGKKDEKKDEQEKSKENESRELISSNKSEDKDSGSKTPKENENMTKVDDFSVKQYLEGGESLNDHIEKMNKKENEKSTKTKSKKSKKSKKNKKLNELSKDDKKELNEQEKEERKHQKERERDMKQWKDSENPEVNQEINKEVSNDTGNNSDKEKENNQKVSTVITPFMNLEPGLNEFNSIQPNNEKIEGSKESLKNTTPLIDTFNIPLSPVDLSLKDRDNEKKKDKEINEKRIREVLDGTKPSDMNVLEGNMKENPEIEEKGNINMLKDEKDIELKVNDESQKNDSKEKELSGEKKVEGQIDLLKDEKDIDLRENEMSPPVVNQADLINSYLPNNGISRINNNQNTDNNEYSDSNVSEEENGDKDEDNKEKQVNGDYKFPHSNPLHL